MWSGCVEQSKMSAEKAKQSLEQTNSDLTAELKQTVTAKQDVERRRKAADSQLQETSLRLAETEAKSTELTEKVAKLQVRMQAPIFFIVSYVSGSRYETKKNLGVTQNKLRKILQYFVNQAQGFTPLLAHRNDFAFFENDLVVRCVTFGS